MANSFIPPETYIKLQKLDQELINETGESLDDYIGIHLKFNGFRYDEITPDDSIVFASTGANGDHFAFDTKKGTVNNLEEAPILFIQPMDSHSHVKLVAQNLKNLLTIYLTLKEFYVLERFDWYEKQEDFINDYDNNYREDIEERLNEFNLVSLRLIQQLNINAIDDVYSYIKDLRNQEG
jgi:hypothetical protein